MFRNREIAARQLADRLRGRKLYDPVVLAIPRGGLVTGAVLARELGAELDVVLPRKLRLPGRPESTLGAVSEDGRVHLTPHAALLVDLYGGYVERERAFQLGEIERRRSMFRAVRPAAPLAGRSVIVVDDAVTTGSTMIAALLSARARKPLELIAAVPVAAAERVEEIRGRCDEVVCLLTPREVWGAGQFYEDFRPVTDEEAIELLGGLSPAPPGAVCGAARPGKETAGARERFVCGYDRDFESE
jgi:predicted phosphoribosyltransferase